MLSRIGLMIAAGLISALAYGNISQRREIAGLRSENSAYEAQAERLKERLDEAAEREAVAARARDEAYADHRAAVEAEPAERDAAVAPALRGAIEGLPE